MAGLNSGKIGISYVTRDFIIAVHREILELRWLRCLLPRR